MEPLLITSAFSIICLSLGRWGPPDDKSAWTILFFFSALNIASLESMGALEAGICEFATIGFLYRYAWGWMGKRQACFIGAGWVVHLCLYLDVNTGSNLVYDRYELWIRALMAGQITLGSNGMVELVERVVSRLRRNRRLGADGIQLDLPSRFSHKESHGSSSGNQK